MKIIIIGCTLSTRRVLEALLKDKKYQIRAIVTLEDKIAYKKSRFVLFDDIASINKIKLHKISQMNDKKLIESIKSLEPDLILESGWSQIIPMHIINIPKKGSIGIHYSYLPKNKGAASLNWALIKNEKKWGVTLFYLDEKIDEGDIIDQEEFEIEDRDDINRLYDKADFLAIQLLRRNLPLIHLGRASRKKQKKSETTYLKARTPSDGRINWRNSNREIHLFIKSLTKPYPGAFTFIKDKKILIWESELVDDYGKTGKIIRIINKRGIIVGTGNRGILLKLIQFEDGIPMWADEFARNFGLKIHSKFS